MLFYFIFVFLSKSTVIRRKKSDRSKDFPLGAKRRSLKGIWNKERGKAKPLAPKKKRKSNIRAPSLERKAPEEEKNKEKTAPLLKNFFLFRDVQCLAVPLLTLLPPEGRQKQMMRTRLFDSLRKQNIFRFFVPTGVLHRSLLVLICSCRIDYLVTSFSIRFCFMIGCDSCLWNFGFIYISKYPVTKNFSFF